MTGASKVGLHIGAFHANHDRGIDGAVATGLAQESQRQSQRVERPRAQRCVEGDERAQRRAAQWISVREQLYRLVAGAQHTKDALRKLADPRFDGKAFCVTNRAVSAQSDRDRDHIDISGHPEPPDSRSEINASDPVRRARVVADLSRKPSLYAAEVGFGEPRHDRSDTRHKWNQRQW